MFWIKACPKCVGDLYEGWDIYGGFVSCLNCGHCLTLEEEAVLIHEVQTIKTTKPVVVSASGIEDEPAALAA